MIGQVATNTFLASAAGGISTMIYTYFKDADVKLGTMDERILSLFAFKKRLSDLGHFPGNYQNIEHLKEQFANQLRRILELKQGK